MAHPTSVFGVVQCRLCPTAVWDVVATKTTGLCVDCYHRHIDAVLAPIEAELEGRIVKVTRRTRSGDRAGQAARYRKKTARRRATAKLAGDRAMRRLKRLFPELYAAFYAAERSKLGLDAWSLDRLLEPGDVESSLDFAATYHHVED